MNTKNKIIWSLGLLTVFLFILLTGRANIQNFEEIQSSIETIYKDRLVVKGLIFDLSTLVHRKEIALISQDANFFKETNESINAQIQEKIRAFRETKLTRFEEETLNRFSHHIEGLKEKEKTFLENSDIKLERATKEAVLYNFKNLKEDLSTLAKIQLNEGKRKLKDSDQAVSSMNTFARAENYMLLIFAVLSFVIIFVLPNKNKD